VIKKILLTAIIINGLHYDSNSQKVEEFVGSALELAKSGEYNHAMAIYDEAIRMYPKDPILYVLKGELITKFNKRLTANENLYQMALQEFNYALKLDSTFWQAYSSRALLHFTHQKFDLAIEDLSAVLRLTRGDNEAQFNALADRANAKYYKRDYEGAIQDYNQALTIQPSNIRVHLNLATLYMGLNQFDIAETKFKKILQKEPTNIDAWNNLSALYLKQSKLKKAIALLEKAIRIYPNAPELYSNLGLAKILTGQPKEALILINKSLSLNPEDSYAYKHRAMAYIELGKCKEACEDLITANRLGYSISFDDEVNMMINENCKN
jgi:tetratricopeptide (TPR) repeat protein